MHFASAINANRREPQKAAENAAREREEEMPFSLTYGEDTKLPLTVRAAAFHLTAATSQRQALVEARLTVLNDTVCKDIEATLRFPLPDSDARVL